MDLVVAVVHHAPKFLIQGKSTFYIPGHLIHSCICGIAFVEQTRQIFLSIKVGSSTERRARAERLAREAEASPARRIRVRVVRSITRGVPNVNDTQISFHGTGGGGGGRKVAITHRLHSATRFRCENPWYPAARIVSLIGDSPKLFAGGIFREREPRECQPTDRRARERDFLLKISPAHLAAAQMPALISHFRPLLCTMPGDY